MSLPNTKNITRHSMASWDYYYCLVDNQPAIISVDLNLVDVVPEESLPYLFYVSVKCKNTSAEGFPAPDEIVHLCAMEDSILDILIPRTSGRFCGRVTTGGTRDLIFYVRNPEIAEKLTREALKAYPGYTVECGNKEDAEWGFYIDFLFPNERELNAIYNHRYLAQLEREGDCLTQEREIEHVFFFPDEQHRDDFIIKAIDAFFQVQKIEKLPASTRNRWKTVVSRMDSVDLVTINALTVHLLDMAKTHQGMYQGWSTNAVRISDAI